MRAWTIEVGTADSARLDDVPEPDPGDGPVLVEMVAVGLCGTDDALLAGDDGEPPEGEARLVLGHEAVGRVVEPAGDLSAGDLVVPLVRHPDPVPCHPCAQGEWDRCENGRFTEHGIKGRHGFARERYRLAPDRLVRVDPDLGDLAALLEPTSVVVKAWEGVERIGGRGAWQPRTALVTGAGPIGLLAAMVGLQRGYDVTVLDRATEGVKPRVVEALGARYTSADVGELDLEPDVVVECTGAVPVVQGVLTVTRPNGVVCLAGTSSPGEQVPYDVGALALSLEMGNRTVFGSVNAGRGHVERALQVLRDADRDWLAGLVSRRVPLERWREAVEDRDDDVKVLLVP